MGNAASSASEVQALLWLRIGADLVAEPWQPSDCDAIARSVRAELKAAHAETGVDGALTLRTPSGDLCRDDLWDRVDGLLLAWLRGLDTLDAGANAVTVEFPDTRIEAQISIVDGSAGQQLHVRYEDIDSDVARATLRSALESAAARLVAALGPSTPALAALAAQHPDQST